MFNFQPKSNHSYYHYIFEKYAVLLGIRKETEKETKTDTSEKAWQTFFDECLEAIKKSIECKLDKDCLQDLMEHAKLALSKCEIEKSSKEEFERLWKKQKMDEVKQVKETLKELWKEYQNQINQTGIPYAYSKELDSLNSRDKQKLKGGDNNHSNNHNNSTREITPITYQEDKIESSPKTPLTRSPSLNSNSNNSIMSPSRSSLPGTPLRGYGALNNKEFDEDEAELSDNEQSDNEQTDRESEVANNSDDDSSCGCFCFRR